MFLVHFEPIISDPKVSDSAAKCAEKAAGKKNFSKIFDAMLKNYVLIQASIQKATI